MHIGLKLVFLGVDSFPLQLCEVVDNFTCPKTGSEYCKVRFQSGEELNGLELSNIAKDFIHKSLWDQYHFDQLARFKMYLWHSPHLDLDSFNQKYPIDSIFQKIKERIYADHIRTRLLRS